MILHHRDEVFLVFSSIINYAAINIKTKARPAHRLHRKNQFLSLCLPVALTLVDVAICAGVLGWQKVHALKCQIAYDCSALLLANDLKLLVEPVWKANGHVYYNSRTSILEVDLGLAHLWV